ncbi:hypothetical protein [uncultured Vibrio sp.]|nr:hypothetical protein [uncultured Vibrio sp.]
MNAGEFKHVTGIDFVILSTGLTLNAGIDSEYQAPVNPESTFKLSI